MKPLTLFRRTTWLSALIAMFSCQTDLDPEANSRIEFVGARLQIAENGAEQIVKLTLHQAASREGRLTIELDTISARLKTGLTLVGRKMEMPIARGQRDLMFTLLPSDNLLADGNMSVKFTLVSVTPGFAIGNQKNLEVFLQDDEQPQESIQSAASFTIASARIPENLAAGYDLTIGLSAPLAGSGSLELVVSSPEAKYNTHYFTEPAAVDGKIVVAPAIGVQQVVIRIRPIDNSLTTGEQSLVFTIANTAGSVIKGTQTSLQLFIADDELTGLPKGYAIAGPLGLKRTYEYDAAGRVAAVVAESANTVQRETYVYDANGRITNISTGPEMNRIFTWTNGRITKSERIEFDILKEYIVYDYDAQGNVSGTANYFRQPNGDYKLSFVVVYLYQTDNNLYKAMYYLPVEGQEEFTLLSTRTYGNYLNVANPFPMVEILPTVKTQTQLPGTFVLEEHGLSLNYNLEYEFLEDGRVSRRYVRGGSQVETTDYFYH